MPSKSPVTESQVEEMLAHIPVASMRYDEWLHIGMATHSAGLSPKAWVNWSAGDPARFKPGECERKWSGFDGSGGVTMGTLVHMARKHGWHGNVGSAPKVPEAGMPVRREDAKPRPPVLRNLPEAEPPAPLGLSPARQLRDWIGALYLPNEKVGVVTSAVRKDDGKWSPGDAGRALDVDCLSAALAQAGSLEEVLGPLNPKAGAWARINPVGGRGASDADVVAWRHALVECDDLTPEEQVRRVLALNLPCKAIVSSGNRSVHAVVRVEARDEAEYRERVGLLYDVCEANGLPVDRSCRNPSRLSRLPGAMRSGRPQELLVVNVGAPSWEAWVGWLREREAEEASGLPPIVSLADITGKNLPPQDPALIEGVVRVGRKLLVTAPSKAGKSFLLIELALALASGGTWLGHRCARSRVLYANLEIADTAIAHRFQVVADKMGIGEDRAGVSVWNLRGRATDLSQMAAHLQATSRGEYGVVIIDPTYKVQPGDENSAQDIARLTHGIDELCETLRCSAVYSHHHSKGAKGNTAAMDRGSGSGVFARDADALLDLSPLEPDGGGQAWLNSLGEGATAWQLSMVLRDFPTPEPRNLAFAYPVHVVDEDGNLGGSVLQGSLAQSRKRGGETARKRSQELVEAQDATIGRAISDCRESGVDPTAREVHERYVSLLEDGIDAPDFKTFQRWLSPSNARHGYRTENGLVVPR